MKKMGTDRATTVFVGDQLFTDVYGANRIGLYSFLVKPIHPKGRDPDCAETVSGGSGTVLLPETGPARKEKDAVGLHIYKKRK